MNKQKSYKVYSVMLGNHQFTNDEIKENRSSQNKNELQFLNQAILESSLNQSKTPQNSIGTPGFYYQRWQRQPILILLFVTLVSHSSTTHTSPHRSGVIQISRYIELSKKKYKENSQVNE
jgi:hypothetical protein